MIITFILTLLLGIGVPTTASSPHQPTRRLPAPQRDASAFVVPHIPIASKGAWRSSSSTPVVGRQSDGRRTRHTSTHSLSMGFSIASLFPSIGKQATKTNADRLSEELYSMLTDDSIEADDAEVMQMIEELEAQPGVTFKEEYLFGGPWRVLWKTNTAWQRFFDPLNSVADNRAYQWYKKDGSVTNIAQAIGTKLFITVDGQGSPASSSKKLPYQVDVEVSQGWLHLLGRKIPLGFIKGTGTTFVVYNDAKIRIFRSDTGGVVVQTKADEPVLV